MQLTIYEIGVHPEMQGKGLGKKALVKVLDIAKKKKATHIQLKCPVDQKSNSFYKHMGFKKIAVEAGRRRKLNVWKLSL